MTHSRFPDMTPKLEKPMGEKAGWRPLGGVYHFENHVCKLREDEVELPDGSRIHYAYLERAQAVIVVPVTRRHEVVLLKQYRYAVDEWCLEVPAGGMHDSAGDSLEAVARREVREEVGGNCGALTLVTSFYSANGMTTENCHVFLAEEVELTEVPETEASETIEILVVAAEEAVAMARRGEMKTGPYALALLLCEPLLRARGHLP